MHDATFEYLKPTEDQIYAMDKLRTAAKMYAAALEVNLPDGPDKTYVMRRLREIAMWANVSLTRHPDGSPRE